SFASIGSLQIEAHDLLSDLLDDHVSNKDLLSDLSHNQYASAINYQLNLALKCHGSVKYLNSVKDKASSLLTKMIIKEWGSSNNMKQVAKKTSVLKKCNSIIFYKNSFNN
ncbi:hypothetical protein DICPUDRAFT_85570, partial [Dictyostelium purpureum]